MLIGRSTDRWRARQIRWILTGAAVLSAILSVVVFR